MSYASILSVAGSVAAVIFTFGIVILFHEFGHFIVSKMSGVKVVEFSFGFWKELFGFDYKGTRYSLRAIPLGGYVKMAGDEIEESKGEEGEFFAAPWYKRIGIVLAGPVMNYILAILVFSIVFAAWGKPVISEKPVVGEIVLEMPADKAGIIKNDLIKSIDNRAVETWEDVAKNIHPKADNEIELQIQRGEEVLAFKVTPELDSKNNVGVIGIMPLTEYERLNVFAAVKEGGYQAYFWTYFTIKYLGSKIARFEKPDIAGPVGIVQIVTKVAKHGMRDLLFLIALISVSIGWFNLIPMSPLDGGHIVLYLYEGISRRKLDKRIVQTANIIGFAFVIFIIIFATYNDLVRLGSGFWK